MSGILLSTLLRTLLAAAVLVMLLVQINFFHHLFAVPSPLSILSVGRPDLLQGL